MTFVLRNLGTEFGLRSPQSTTFNDHGRIPVDSPLRLAYQHVTPTLIGLLAGSMRLLRDPHVVLALGTSPNLVQHLLNLYSTQLAVVFGDSRTVQEVRNLLLAAHRRRITTVNQPDWFAAATGRRREFVVGEDNLKKAVAAAMATAVAKAHLATGVLHTADGNNYCRHAGQTLGWGNAVGLTTPDLQTLQAAGNEYEGLPLMNVAQLRLAGVPGVLKSLLETRVGNGQQIYDLLPLFGPLMWPEDRAALHVAHDAHETDMFLRWCETYQRRVTVTDGGPQTGPLVEPLTDNDMFAVALRCRQNARA